MKKLKVIIVLGVLMFGMSSCVYSLFPIYTKDTLVFLPELVGKWQTNSEAPDEYILFEPMTENKKKEMGLITKSESTITINNDTDNDKSTYSYTMSGDGWSIKSDEPITVEIDGEEVSDPAKVRAYYDDMFGDMQTEASEKLEGLVSDGLSNKMDSVENENTIGEGIEKLANGLKKIGEGLRKADAEFKGTSYYPTDDTYKMIVMDGDERSVYQAHLAKIGEDYFLDVYPLAEYTNEVFTNNLFPVHTFFKIEVDSEEMRLTLFDLDKLNELFESNLIRLRHEYVDGNVLITAQPKEIQKFLDKYSDDESVFESTEVYSRLK